MDTIIFLLIAILLVLLYSSGILGLLWETIKVVGVVIWTLILVLYEIIKDFSKE